MMTAITHTDPMLKNIQANILKGHGRNFAHHLFFKIDATKKTLARQWIATFAVKPGGITSAHEQLELSGDFKSGKITDGGTIFTLSLSAPGYDKLGAGAFKPAGNSFNNGMQANAGLLGDKVNNWEEAFKTPADMLIIVADDNSNTARTAAENIITQLTTFAVLLLNQKGNILKTKSGIGIEHFGYADGISQPLFLKKDIDNQTSTTEWDDATDPDLLLVQDNPEVPDSFGSFLVFRKLEQHVKTFNDAEDVLVGIKDVDGNVNKELAGAMLVGRFENSVPVVKTSIGTQSNPPVISNDFNYLDDLPAVKCPFHAHTRLMNPRKGDTVAGDVTAQRITRRGIPYDEVNRIPEDRITTISDDLLEIHQPNHGVGLLFMCYQSSIETQFEIIQGIWANQGNIAGHLTGGQDSIISQGANPDKTLPVQWGQPAQTAPFSFKDFVSMKGGAYFFTPGVSFLKSLAIIVPAV